MSISAYLTCIVYVPEDLGRKLTSHVPSSLVKLFSSGLLGPFIEKPILPFPASRASTTNLLNCPELPRLWPVKIQFLEKLRNDQKKVEGKLHK